MSSECIVIVSPFFSLLTEFSRVNIGHPDVAVNPYGKSPRAVILEPGKRRIVLCLSLIGFLTYSESNQVYSSYLCVCIVLLKATRCLIMQLAPKIDFRL